MVMTQQRQTQLWSGIRATPFLFFFHAVATAAVYPTAHNLLYLAAYCVNFVVNSATKMTMKAIYEGLGVERLPLLGIGKRPPGASNCRTFLTWPDTPAVTYGMPSGHSQNAWFFATFMILELWRQYSRSSNGSHSNNVDHGDNLVSRHPALAIVLAVALAGFASVVSYSRVWVDKCHTLEQVIVGGLLGIALGTGAHYSVHAILDRI